MVPSPPWMGRGGSGGSLNSAHSDAVKVSTSTVYVQPYPTLATRMPASKERVVPRPMTIMLRALAAGSSSRRTRRGTIALRAEPFTPAAADWTATSAYRIQVFSSCSQACNAMAIVTSQRAVEDSRATVRRSWASAIEPPYSPENTSGIRATRPSMPTASVEPVRSYTCRLTATTVSCVPIEDNPLPTHGRRYAGLSRSGVMSARSWARLYPSVGRGRVRATAGPAGRDRLGLRREQ